MGLLIVDELPYFLNGSAKDERELFADLLRDLIARSRKVGPSPSSAPNARPLTPCPRPATRARGGEGEGGVLCVLAPG